MGTTIFTEQDVCVSCGFCCDRTLFDSAALTDDEAKLPANVNLNILEINGKQNFTFPCPNFCSKCTVYEKNKPEICGKFYCEVIKKMRRDELSVDEAKRIIEEVRLKRDELIALFNRVTGQEIKSFREGLFFLESDTTDLNDPTYKTLYLQFQLLNTHITKQFKSKEIWNTYYENINQLY